MTPTQAADLALPRVQRLIALAEPEIKATVPRLQWLVARPSWAIVTSAAVLRILLRLVIALAAGWAAPWLLPLATALGPLAEQWGATAEVKQHLTELVGLLQSAQADTEPVIQQVLFDMGPLRR